MLDASVTACCVVDDADHPVAGHAFAILAVERRDGVSPATLDAGLATAAHAETMPLLDAAVR
ncbi:MAG TPA: hypothetical protein VIZ17_15215 [Acetobacteraceae bacterium]